MENTDQPFYQLPEALVEEMLSKSQDIGDLLLNSMSELSKKRQAYRNELIKANLLKRSEDLPDAQPPTTCGIDGSYVVDRLMATDLVAVAAIAMEGLIPPSEERQWEKPQHKVFIHPQSHDPDTTAVARGIMWEMEIILASRSPHDVVFIDGSITNPFLNLNAAVNKWKDFQDSKLGNELADHFEEFLNSYRKIIGSEHSDKLWVGLPKYTSKREIGKRFDWPADFDDRAILTSLLQAGEYTVPVRYEQPGEKPGLFQRLRKGSKTSEQWHVGMKTLQKHYKKEWGKPLSQIIRSIKNLHVCYYKPHPYTPALRIEVPQAVKANENQLAMLFKAIEFQCPTPGMMEPYPLFMADRMVKSLSRAMPAFRQTATQRMAQHYKDDLSEIIFGMNSYRSERGK